VTVSDSLASKPAATVSDGLASKPTATVCGGFASEPATTVFSSLASKPVTIIFSSLASKLVATVSPGLDSKLVAMVSLGLDSKPAVGFLVEPQIQGGGGFLDLDLKIGNYGLVICASKSPRWFLGLGLKTKQASVCRLRHKNDGGLSAWDTRQDLAPCFA
jgi:hypothetical protein